MIFLFLILLINGIKAWYQITYSKVNIKTLKDFYIFKNFIHNIYDLCKNIFENIC